MGIPSWMSLGFLRPGPQLAFGSSQRAFGTPGAGGSFGFADPDARLGFAYVMNNMDYYMFDTRARKHYATPCTAPYASSPAKARRRRSSR